MGAVRIGIIAAVLATATSAMAEDKVAARQAYLEGSKYYDLNQYNEALEAFKRAYWNYEEPTFLYNIAQCHRALKHKSEAIDFYRSYLRKSPDARNRAEVQRIIAELEAALTQERALSTAPPQGTLPTDGKSPPSAAPGHAAETQPATTPPSAAPEAVAPAAMPSSTTVEARHERKPVYKRGWFWGVMAGAAVVVAGVAVGVVVATSPAKDPAPSYGTIKVN